MSETLTPTPPVDSAPAPPAPAPPAPVQVPEGYVPQADLERVEGQRRGFQSENETLKARLAALEKTAPTTPVAQDAASELAALRQEIALDRKIGANTALVPTLQTEFPYADPDFYDREVIGQYESPEALRAAVEADHARVAAIVKAAEDAKEAAVKAALGGQSPLGPVAPPSPGVDPTVQQLNSMTTEQLGAFELANPGVIKRVMDAAMAAAG